MKTALIIYEGMGDRPDEALQRRTPMEVARCSVATDLAVTGCGGILSMGRSLEDQRSEAVLGRCLGFSAATMRTLWRGPLEALGAGVDTTSAAWVFRADLVTLDGKQLMGAGVPGISLKETQELVEAMAPTFAGRGIRLTAIECGRVAVVVEDSAVVGLRSVSPFDLEGEDLVAAWPNYRRQKWLRSFVETSFELLCSHPVNEVRVDLGENPANALWPWGGGMPVAAGDGAGDVDAGQLILVSNGLLARGFANYLGIDIVPLSDPWEEVEGRRQPFRIAGIVKALHERDHVVFYVEARLPGGRYGKPTDKVWALECLDHVVLAPVVTLLDAVKPYRMALAVDGAVSAATGRWMKEKLPVIVSGEGIEPDGVGHWDEACCSNGSLGSLNVDDLLDSLRKE